MQCSRPRYDARMRMISTSICLLVASSAFAQDWTQWRGPGRDGMIPAAVIPTPWPAAVTRGWSVEIGEGYSSPVVAGGRAFVHSRRDPDEIVTAIDLATGKTAWQQSYQSEFKKNQYATQMAKGPNSTPIVVGSRLYTLGATGILTAWNITDGTVAWRNDYSASIDTSKLFCGTSMSPMLEGGSLIVQVGSDVHGGRVIALDPATGKERWVSKGLGPGYASPVAITIDKNRQIVTMTNGSIIGIDATNGTPLWSIPFPDEWNENIVTPIWTGSALIVSGTRQGTQAYALARSGGTWQPKQIWKNADVTMYTVSPVFADGVIYGMSNKRRGHFVALDAETGTVKWATQGRDGNHASILQTREHVLYLTDGGALVVAQRTPEDFKELKRYEIGKSPTWTLPVFLPDGLLVRETDRIVKLTWS
jgi:outer membrane protein assembly factor BamB